MFEVKADVWKSMYPFFCNQALSTPDVAEESLKILDVLIDYGVVGDYINLEKVLLHKSDEVAHLALDVLRKIKGLTTDTRIEGVSVSEGSDEGIEKVPLKINQQINKTEQLIQMEKDLQSRIYNLLKKEDSMEKVSDIEEMVEELCRKTQEVPSNLTQAYDNKFKALEDSIEELKKLVNLNIVNENDLVEKVVSKKLADIEEKVEDLCRKTPEVPSNLTEDHDDKFKTLEDSMEELKKLVNSNIVNETARIEKAAGEVLERVKPSWHISTSEISSIPQLAQKKVEDSQYIEEQKVRLHFLDNTPETSIILLNWVKFLMERVGRNNLSDILEYYVEIGWISEEVSSKMADYANGIDYYVEKSTWNLLEVHTKSLLFIEQLRRHKKDKKVFSLLKYKQGSTIQAHGL
ncbi:MAG: hypothetical protein O8C66_04915 [Candidatus Methanoperedens sp.]|nr:hypothetical protein [Candidatus Methanoperedens sp.]MCZ7369830.1 hypothetical protein [Candidatus Methanoperedens sp.]